MQADGDFFSLPPGLFAKTSFIIFCAVMVSLASVMVTKQPKLIAVRYWSYRLSLTFSQTSPNVPPSPFPNWKFQVHCCNITSSANVYYTRPPNENQTLYILFFWMPDQESGGLKAIWWHTNSTCPSNVYSKSPFIVKRRLYNPLHKYPSEQLSK